jgi:hypothetical protein
MRGVIGRRGFLRGLGVHAREGVNPRQIFGIYDVVRWDIAWLDR